MLVLRSLAVTLLLSSCVLAQQPAPVLRGTWTATAGPKQMFRGAWSAQALPNRPNGVIGSWTILNDARQIMMEGTWSAEKSARGWQGTWSARVLTGRSSAGRSSYGAPISGTWQTETPASNVQTFAELLQRTLEKEIAGSWRRGQLAGYWWLNGSLR
jgi:hypothetical protein